MDILKEYNRNSKFKSKEDYYKIVAQIFQLGAVKSEYKDQDTLSNKENINKLLVGFLENLLSNDMVQNKKDKLAVINLLDELNFRNEILGMIEAKNSKNTKAASKRIGKKFMSSVENQDSNK